MGRVEVFEISGQKPFFVKDQALYVLDFESHICHNCSSLLSLCENSYKGYINEWMWLCSSRTLFMGTEILILVILTCHNILKKIFNHLKIWKLCYSCQTIQRQMAGQIQFIGHSLPTLILHLELENIIECGSFW